MRVDMPAAKMMPATRPVSSARIYLNLRLPVNRASAHDPNRRPARTPLAQAHWKLNPPKSA